MIISSHENLGNIDYWLYVAAVFCHNWLAFSESISVLSISFHSLLLSHCWIYLRQVNPYHFLLSNNQSNRSCSISNQRSFWKKFFDNIFTMLWRHHDVILIEKYIFKVMGRVVYQIKGLFKTNYLTIFFRYCDVIMTSF